MLAITRRADDANREQKTDGKLHKNKGKKLSQQIVIGFI
jgi:hypothetical protein